MRFLKRATGRHAPDESVAGRVADERASEAGRALLESVAVSLAPLAEEFAEISDAFGIEAEAELAMDRLFAFNVLLRWAGEKEWSRYAQFSIDEAIPRRDDQNAALLRIQEDAEPWLRKLQIRANRWAETELTEYVAGLPDSWFRVRLPGGQLPLVNGVKLNCVDGLMFAVVALTSFDFADDAVITKLYVPVHLVVPIVDVLALAGAPKVEGSSDRRPIGPI